MNCSTFCKVCGRHLWTAPKDLFCRLMWEPFVFINLWKKASTLACKKINFSMPVRAKQFNVCLVTFWTWFPTISVIRNQLWHFVVLYIELLISNRIWHILESVYRPNMNISKVTTLQLLRGYIYAVNSYAFHEAVDILRVSLWYFLII